MRPAWLLVVLVACGGSQPRPAAPVFTASPTYAPVAPPPPATPAPEVLDEAAVIARSHAFYEVLDGTDAAAFEALVGPSFVLFDQARSYTTDDLAGRLRARAEGPSPQRARTWKQERVTVGPNTAVFIGSAVESSPASAEDKAVEWEGWNTLVWVHDGTSWKVAHAQWQVGGLEAERSMWNEAYRKSLGFKPTANQHLVDTIKGRKSGTALDLAMGQGRNAVFLATKGWKVTGVDISDEGLRIAQAAAAKARVKLTTVQADVDGYDLGKDRWDLVTMIYAGADPATIEKAKVGLKRNGLFVVEYFHRDASVGVGIGGFSEGELRAQFDGWKIVKDEVVEDVADWGLRTAKLVRFVAQKP